MPDDKEISKLFKQLKIEGDDYFKRAKINPPNQFRTIIEEDGGKFVDRDYSFTKVEIENVKELQKQADALSIGKAVEQIDAGHILLKEFSRINVTESGIEVLPIPSMDYLDEQLKVLANNYHRKINQEQAQIIIDCWLGSIDVLNDPELELVNAELWSQTLYYVDEALNGFLLEGMESLIDLLIHKEDEIEIFLSGHWHIEEFVNYVKKNNKELKEQVFGTFATQGWDNSLKHFLNHIAKNMFWDFHYIPSDGGRMPDPENAEKKINKTPYYRNKLVEHYKKKKEKNIPPKAEQSQWLFQTLVLKKRTGKLLPIEEDYYNCMGHRAILKRRDIVPTRLIYQIAQGRGKTIIDPMKSPPGICVSQKPR